MQVLENLGRDGHASERLDYSMWCTICRHISVYLLYVGVIREQPLIYCMLDRKARTVFQM